MELTIVAAIKAKHNFIDGILNIQLIDLLSSVKCS